MMHGHGKSDSSIVPTKPPNEAEPEAKEVVEGRGLAKGNLLKRNMYRTQSRQACPARLSGYVRQQGGIGVNSVIILSLSCALRRHPRQEPDAVILHVRIRGGGHGRP
jgi:hypothetical protein